MQYNRGNDLKLDDSRFRLDIRKKLVIMRVVRLTQVALRDGGCPISGNIQSPTGLGSEQCDGVEDVPAHCWGVGRQEF